MGTDKNNETAQTVDQMRTAIAAITGRSCVSKDPAHLRRRLAELRKNQDAGRRADDTTTVVSISMHGRAKSAAARIASAEGIGVSELVRRALGAWAGGNGYRAEASNFEVE